MPFDRRGLTHLGGGLHRYRTTDDAATIDAPGYWTAGWPVLRRGDQVFRVTLNGAGQVASSGLHVITASTRTAVSSGSNAFAGLEAGFQAAAFEGGVNDERYRWYISGSPFSGGTAPIADLQAMFDGGRRVIRNFMMPFDTNNDPGIAKTVATLTTGDTLAPDEISIGDMGADWAPHVGMEVCIKWAGPASYNVGGIVVQRQGHYQISSVNGTFVRLRITGQTRTVAGSSSQALTTGAALALSWRPFNSRISNWYTSVQRAIDIGFFVVATPFGDNLWDRATTQANIVPFNDFGWPAIDKLHASWCTHMAANITDPAHRLVLQWQNEDVADSTNLATAEALSKPHRERMLLAMRAAAPAKLIMAGGARWSSEGSLAQIVPQAIPGLIYTFHTYSNDPPGTALAPVLAWRAANGNRFAWPGEIDRLTYTDGNGTVRRDHLRTWRTWMRANLGSDGTWWGRRYAPFNNNDTTRELGTDASNTFTPRSAMREFLDERPIAQTIPTISGTAQQGQTLTATNGTWTGRGTLDFEFQWQRGTTDIPGATGPSYVVPAGDVGQTLRVRITGVNTLGSTVAFSADTAPVAPPAGAMTSSFNWKLNLALNALPLGGFDPSSLNPTIAFDAQNAAVFGGSFPANGASVTSTSAAWGATHTLAQRAAAPVPTFATDAFGSGRHGLRFLRSTGQRLGSAGAPAAFWGPMPNANPSATIVIVARWPTGGNAAGTQFLAGVCHPTGTSNSAHNNLSVITQTTGTLGRATGATTTGDLQLGSAGADNDNLLFFLERNGAASPGTRLTLSRDGTLNANAGPGGTDSLSGAAAAADVIFSVGGREYNNTTDLFLDAWVGAVYVIPRALTAGEKSDFNTWLRSRWSIA